MFKISLAEGRKFERQTGKKAKKGKSVLNKAGVLNSDFIIVIEKKYFH